MNKILKNNENLRLNIPENSNLIKSQEDFNVYQQNFNQFDRMENIKLQKHENLYNSRGFPNDPFLQDPILQNFDYVNRSDLIYERNEENKEFQEGFMDRNIKNLKQSSNLRECKEELNILKLSKQMRRDKEAFFQEKIKK